MSISVWRPDPPCNDLPAISPGGVLETRSALGVLEARKIGRAMLHVHQVPLSVLVDRG
jgi:hypothetical protein